MADLYLNVNAQGYLKLEEEASTFKLNAKRNWWGSNVTWVLDKRLPSHRAGFPLSGCWPGWQGQAAMSLP